MIGVPKRPNTPRPQFRVAEGSMRGITLPFSIKSGHQEINRTGTRYLELLPRDPQARLAQGRNPPATGAFPHGLRLSAHLRRCVHFTYTSHSQEGPSVLTARGAPAAPIPPSTSAQPSAGRRPPASYSARLTASTPLRTRTRTRRGPESARHPPSPRTSGRRRAAEDAAAGRGRGGPALRHHGTDRDRVVRGDRGSRGGGTTERLRLPPWPPG
jgi:hypothetical protein